MKKIILLFISILTGLSLNISVVFAQNSTDTIRTKVGNPPVIDSGWPTTGYITQGPRGSTSHARIQSVGGGPALDIANSFLTPIYATFDGIIRTYDCNKGACDSTYGSLGNYAKLIPTDNPSAIILYGHMASIEIPDGSRVTPGTKIGLMGDTGAAPGAYHLHYEFRGIPMAPPNIPEIVTPESCDSTPCSPQSVSSGN